jgi:hypothetical protein
MLILKARRIQIRILSEINNKAESGSDKIVSDSQYWSCLYILPNSEIKIKYSKFLFSEISGERVEHYAN